MQPLRSSISTGMMERLRAVEEVLKSPENEPIQNGVNLIMDVYKGGNPKRKSKEGSNSLDSIIESQIERAQKVNTLILSIRKYIFKSDMKEESKEGFFLDVNFYIFQKLWPLIEKGCEDILKMDKKFAEHLSDLKMFITTKFLGFPDTMNNDTLTGHSLFQGTIRALKFLELPNSPYDKLQIIYGIYKNCNQILNDYELVSSADALVNIFIFMIIQAEVKNVVSNIIFLNLFVLPEDRNGEMFCYFVSFNLAYEYLEKIEPGTILVKTPLNTRKEPKILRGRVEKSDYREIITTISRFTKRTQFSSMRAKSVKKGFSIGLALSIPIAAVVGLASLGLGTPLSVLILSAGAGIGSACGAANSTVLKKSFSDFNSYIENLNDTVLKEKGVFLVSPLVTNSFNNLFGISQSSARKISHVQWIVKTLNDESGNPIKEDQDDNDDPDDDDEEEEDDVVVNDNNNDDDDFIVVDDDDDDVNGNYGSSNNDKVSNNKCEHVEYSDSDKGSATASDSDDLTESAEEMEEAIFNFMNFDFIDDESRSALRLHKSKSSISIRNKSGSSSRRKKKKEKHYSAGIIVVSSGPQKGISYEDDDEIYTNDFMNKSEIETLEAEDILSDDSEDDDVGYDNVKTFKTDKRMKIIRKWD